jgi:hypothetical protein
MESRAKEPRGPASAVGLALVAVVLIAIAALVAFGVRLVDGIAGQGGRVAAPSAVPSAVPTAAVRGAR